MARRGDGWYGPRNDRMAVVPTADPQHYRFTILREPGVWLRPRWDEVWFLDAFQGTMAQLLRVIESDSEPEISGADNLKTIALVEAVRRAAEEHRVVEPSEGFGQLISRRAKGFPATPRIRRQ